MLHMNVPKRYWSLVVLTAAYIINRLPSRVLGFKTPHETLHNKAFNLAHFKIFGCNCFVHVQAPNCDRLEARAVKCIFVGYSPTQKATNVLILSRRSVLCLGMFVLMKRYPTTKENGLMMMKVRA